MVEVSMDKRSMIVDIVTMEWEQFTNVQNIGKRAYCQDRMLNFIYARTAYLTLLSEDILYSYLLDLRHAVASGLSLVAQKYAYMMEETDPAYYASISHLLMPISSEKQALLDCIMLLYHYWLSEVRREAVYQNRPIYSSENGNVTSVETYMRGEFKTYSTRTLRGIFRYFTKWLSEGRNFPMENLKAFEGVIQEKR